MSVRTTMQQLHVVTLQLNSFIHRQDTATATVAITDVNDNPPELCEPHLEHSMSEYSGSSLSAADVTILSNLSCVSDVDSTSFKYRIVDTSKTNGWFSVDQDNVCI